MFDTYKRQKGFSFQLAIFEIEVMQGLFLRKYSSKSSYFYIFSKFEL
jgi:hypothetical protein